MKKLFTIFLALSFLSTVVSVTFAQETTKKTTKKKSKKGGKKKTEETKKS